MNYSVATIPLFDKQAKKLSKKYASLKNDLSQLINELSANPTKGIALGNGFYKVRMAITSKNKGKSAGARVITYVRVKNETIFLVAIYDKSGKSTITDKELKDIFSLIP